MRSLNILAGGITALGMLAASPALANPEAVDQVEKAEAEAGELELELRTLFIPNGEGNGGLTLEYGLSDTLQLGVEFEMESDGGKLIADEISVQMTGVFADPEESPVGLAVQVAAGYAFEDRALAVKGVAIVDLQRQGWRAYGNLIAASREGDRSQFDLSYAARFDLDLKGNFTVGLETGGGIVAGDPVGHWIGPVLAVPLGKSNESPRLELSGFAALSRNTPDVQIRIEIDWPF